MFNRKIFRLLISTFLISTLSACGGGGGVDNNTSAQASSSSVASMTSSSQSSATLQPLTRKNTPVVVSNYLDLILFAKDTAAAIVKQEYNTGLPDGSYKDNCEGGKGSFEITISKNGDLLNQKYNNCEISVTEDGTTEKLLISGEELITTTRNENTYSFVSISWKNYSISINGEPADTLDGSFNYQGFLYFGTDINYVDITSRIKINAKINTGGNIINAENVDLTYNFPRIFDSYPSPSWGNSIMPMGLHVFSGTIISAKGTLSINDVKSNFLFDSAKQRVTFLNSAASKSYLDITTKGFYIKWDDNNNEFIDASIFLSEGEYPVISEHLSEQNSTIYFTRYPNEYGTPLPPNHFYEGQYKFISLSKGASTEIDVRELFTTKSGSLLTYEIDNKSSSDDWEKIEAGRFKLKFPNSNGSETFVLKVTALDIYNNRSPEITVTVRMNDNLADTDKDGILDINDIDIDNDGVANNSDSFPKNPAESSDWDFDGIGDNGDPDRDNDGIANNDDAFPNDNSCHTASFGDEYGCYLSSAKYAFDDGNSIVYFIQTLLEGDKMKARLIKFDAKNNQFLAPSPMLDINGGFVSFRAYNPVNNSILMLDGLNKKLYLVKLDDLSINPIRDVGNDHVYPYFSENGYFAVQITDLSDYSIKVWVEIFDKDGNLTDSNKEDSLKNPNYFLAYRIQKTISVPFCKFSITIGNEGKLITHGNPTETSDVCSGVNTTSPNTLYTFSQPMGYEPFRVYDVNGNKLLQVNGYQMQWLDNSLVYLNIEPNFQPLIAVNDLINNKLHTYEDKSLAFDDIFVIDQKVISFQRSGYMRPARLIVFDKELTPEFDSLTK